MIETTINIYPILKLLFFIGIFSTIIILCYFVKECFFKTKDTDITTNIIDKYPNVTECFKRLPLKEMSIENNQELYEHDKRLYSVESRLDAVEKRLNNG